MALTVLIVSLFILMGIGIHIAWALGLSSLCAILIMDIPLSTIPQKIYSGMDIFTLMCIPFFILAGEIMAHGGITKRLLLFGVSILGFIRGGLAMANVIASMLFGGITGSAVADVSALGPVEIKMMSDNGYDRPFSAAITAASACIGPIIPPSIPIVLYAMSVRGVSIGTLFLAGVIPGILVGLSLMITAYFLSVKRNYPKKEKLPTFKEILVGLKDASLALFAPFIIFGGIIRAC